MSLSYALRNLDHQDIDIIYKNLPFIKTLSHHRGTHTTPLENRHQSLAEALLLARDSFTLTHDILREKNKQIEILTGVASLGSSKSGNGSSEDLKSTDNLTIRSQNATSSRQSSGQQKAAKQDSPLDSQSKLHPPSDQDEKLKKKKIPSKKDLGAAIAVFSSTPSMYEEYGDDDNDYEEYEAQRRPNHGLLIFNAKSASSLRSRSSRTRSLSRKRTTPIPNFPMVQHPSLDPKNQHSDYSQSITHNRRRSQSHNHPEKVYIIEDSENTGSTTISNKTGVSSNVLSSSQSQTFDSVIYPAVSDPEAPGLVKHENEENSNKKSLYPQPTKSVRRSLSSPELASLLEYQTNSELETRETPYATPFVDKESAFAQLQTNLQPPVSAFRHETVADNALQDSTGSKYAVDKTNPLQVPARFDSLSPLPRNLRKAFLKQKEKLPAVIPLDPHEELQPSGSSKLSGLSPASTSQRITRISGNSLEQFFPAKEEATPNIDNWQPVDQKKIRQIHSAATTSKSVSKNKGKVRSSSSKKPISSSVSTPELLNTATFPTANAGGDARGNGGGGIWEGLEAAEILAKNEDEPAESYRSPGFETEMHDFQPPKSHTNGTHEKKRHKHHRVLPNELNRQLPRPPKKEKKKSSSSGIASLNYNIHSIRAGMENHLVEGSNRNGGMSSKHAAVTEPPIFKQPKPVEPYDPVNDYLPQYLQRSYTYWRWTLNSPEFNVPKRYAVWISLHLRHSTIWYHIQQVIPMADEGKFASSEEVNAYILRKSTGHIKAQEEIARFEFNQLIQPPRLPVIVFNSNFLRIFNKIRHFYHPDRLAIQYYDRISPNIRNRLNVNFYENYALPGRHHKGHKTIEDTRNGISSSSRVVGPESSAQARERSERKAKNDTSENSDGAVPAMKVNPDFWNMSGSKLVPAKPFISLEGLMLLAEQVDDVYRPAQETKPKSSILAHLLGRHK